MLAPTWWNDPLFLTDTENFSLPCQKLAHTAGKKISVIFVFEL